MNPYIYLITDFPNSAVNPTTLGEEILAEVTITAVLTGISVRSGQDCTIWFATALSPAEVTALDAVVAAHQGIPTPVVTLLATVGLESNEVVVTAVDPAWQRIGGAVAVMESWLVNVATTAMGTSFAGIVAGTTLRLRLRQESDDTVLSDGTWQLADTGGSWVPTRFVNLAQPNLSLDEFVIEASMSDNLGTASVRSLTLGVANVTAP